MPNIFIDVWTRLHEKSQQDVDRDIQRRYTKSGQDAAKNFADAVERGLQSRSKSIRSAANQVMSTSSALAERQRDLSKATNAHSDSLTRLDRLQQGIADRQRGLVDSTRLLAQTEKDLSSAQQERITLGGGVLRLDRQISEQQRIHIKNAKELRDAQLQLQRIRLYDKDEGRGARILRQQKQILELNKRNANETRALRDAALDLARAKDIEAQAGDRVKKIQGDVNSLLAEGTKRTNELAAAKKDLAQAERDAAKAAEDVARRTARVRSASRSHDLARRGFLDAGDAVGRRRGRRGGGGGEGGLGGAERTLGGVFNSIPFVPGGKAGAIIGTSLITGLGGIAEAATTATQALWTLPGALLAAGAGIATLKIGMSGFDRALKDMGDAKKFAQDLQNLAPNAQQAALEIQHLSSAMGGFKKMVEQALFAGVAPAIHNLASAFIPQLKQLFTGISGAFNQMFQGAVGQLTTGSRSGVVAVINNIVAGFQSLAPVMAPVVDAFVKLAQVGTSFLPAFGTAIADAAKRFDEFITNAQKTGKLQHWIMQGLAAAQEFGRFIGELAHKWYDVFGNKSPQQFDQTLHTIVGTLTTMGQIITGIANGVNDLVRALQPVATMVGGWPHLIELVVGAWALWKVDKVLGLLGLVGQALRVGLPAAAAEGAAGVSAALGGIKLPAWLTFLMGNPELLGGAALFAGGQFNASQALKGNPYKTGMGQNDQKTIDSLKVPSGVPKPGSFDARNAIDSLSKQGDPGMKWVEQGTSALDQARRYAWLMNHQDTDKSGFQAPSDYGQGGAAGAPGAPRNSPNAPWWSAGDPNGAPPPWIPAPGKAPMIWQPGQGYVPQGSDWTPYDVPAVPGKGAKGIGKDKAALPYGADYGAAPRPGESSEVYSAEGEVLNAKHRLEQDRQTLLNLEKDNNATAEEIQAAKNKIITDQRQQYQAEMHLAETQQEATKKALKGLKDANNEFNNIDEDFGLSKGLPGLVKNLVGMLGDLAAAPLMGQLNAVAQATGTDKNTFGAFGMMAQRNESEGRSALFGIPAGQPGGPPVLSPGQSYAIYGSGGPTSGTLGQGAYSGGFGSGSGGTYAMPGFSQTAGAPQVGLAGAVRPAGTGKSAMAQAIYQSVIQAGYSPDTAMAAVSASMLESGLNPDITNASGHHGLFQESRDKPSAGAAQQIQWFLGALGAAGGPGAVNQDPMDAIADKVERGGYPGSNYAKFMPGAQALVGQQASWTPQYSSSGGGGGGWLGAILASSASPMGALGGGLGGGLGGAMGLPLGDARGVPLAPNVEAGIRSIGGLPTNYPTSGPGAYKVPAWVQQLAAQFGLTASTYASGGSLHQMGYAFDFNGPREKQDAFAQYVTDYLKNQTLQLIHQDGNQDWGIASGQSVGPGTSMPGYYAGDFPGHQDHVHWAPMPGGVGAPSLASSMNPNVHSGVLADITRPDPNSIGSAGDAPSIVQNPSGRQGMSIPDWMNTLPSPIGGAANGPGMAQKPYPSGVGNAGTGAVPPPGGTGAPKAGGPGGGAFSMPVGSGSPEGEDPTAPPAPIGAAPGGGWQPQGGGANGIGGLPMAAAIAGASMFPGGGAAAQTASQLINRTIGYGQQAASIGMEGLLDFWKVSSPDSDAGGLSDLNKSWYGRVLQGFAGARPATGSGAGKAPKPKKSADDDQGKGGKGGPDDKGGDTTHNLYGNNGILAMPGSKVTVHGGQQPGMGDTSNGLAAQSSAPGATSMAGMTMA